MPPAKSAPAPATIVANELSPIQRQQRCEAFESSFVSESRNLLRGAAPSVHESMSAGLKAECEAQSAAVAEITAAIKTAQTEVGTALAEADESEDCTALVVAIEGARFDQPALASKIVKLWATSLDLSGRKVAELTPVAQKLNAEFLDTVEDAKAQLTEIGSGLETQPAYPGNTHAAEQQFDQVARRNLQSRAAWVKAQNAKAELSAAMESRHVAQRGFDSAKAYLRKLAVRLANS